MHSLDSRTGKRADPAIEDLNDIGSGEHLKTAICSRTVTILSSRRRQLRVSRYIICLVWM